MKDWILAILIRLFKNKGDKRHCDNYLGISLLVVTSKLFTRVILNRVQKVIDRQLMEEQAGFRPNRSTLDQIFIRKMAMEKSREFNRPIFMFPFLKERVLQTKTVCLSVYLSNKSQSSIPNLVKSVHDDSKENISYDSTLVNSNMSSVCLEIEWSSRDRKSVV